MTARLMEPLGSYPDYDEFQIGRMLIWVKYAPDIDRAFQLAEADKRLLILEDDIPALEQLVTMKVCSSVSAKVIGIHIEPDGLAEYDCTFYEGVHEDEICSVSRLPNGKLEFICTDGIREGRPSAPSILRSGVSNP